MKHNATEVYHVTNSHNRPYAFAANSRPYPGQPQHMVGRVQNRAFPQTHQARSTHYRMAGRGHRRASGNIHHGSGEPMNAVCFPAHHAPIQQRRHVPHAEHVLGRMPFTWTAHVFPVRYGYSFAQLPMSPRQRHHANLFGSRYEPARLPMPIRHRHHAYPTHTRYELAPFPIPSRHCFHAYPVSARYRPAANRMRTRRFPHADTVHTAFRTDACSFVRRCLRGPAYVSYRRFASYSTAGEWLRPFEPRKAKRRERR